MNAREVVAEIVRTGVVPVVRVASEEAAMRAVDAIKEGGISVLEITMTVPGALRVIEALADRYGTAAVVGAGTVLDPETARACILAGARFVVSPELNLGTVALCRRHGVAVMPGALTPTEIRQAWESGADMVKVFPCDAMGGARYLKALKGPLPHVDLLPTGGVSLETAADYLRAGASALGVGGDLVDAAALRAGQAGVITDRARRFVDVVREARASL
jgi:2-dehydro-3-deoxyphosphogluconate aldolase/(4S)-4-hydroxy-2-oxoglutarate aldolase